jgi:hypothetical protein
MSKIAALFVETDGCYYGLPNVDPWDEQRDARFYRGPWPIIAHPPCQRWGRYWHGSPRKPHQYKLGDDGGCFASAMRSLVLCGGVLEHPAYSNAWAAFNLPRPDHRGGWRLAGGFAVAHVEQGHYGHRNANAVPRSAPIDGPVMTLPIVRNSPANPWWWGLQRALWWWHTTNNGVRY